MGLFVAQKRSVYPVSASTNEWVEGAVEIDKGQHELTSPQL
jgi:hypothetical protein